LALAIDRLVAPHHTSKSQNTKQKNNLFAIKLVKGKDAIAFEKLEAQFVALLKTMQIENQLPILVCSKNLSCPTCFDYGVNVT